MRGAGGRRARWYPPGAVWKVLFGREVDGRWIAEIPSIPGCLAYGCSREESRAAVIALAREEAAARAGEGRRASGPFPVHGPVPSGEAPPRPAGSGGAGVDGTSWTCRHCGEAHPRVPDGLGFEHPDYLYAVPEREWGRRVRFRPDRCIVDDEHFFILANLEIPVRGREAPFLWSVWSSLSRKNFERTESLWSTPGRESEPPCFGWLNSALPGYPDTVNLKCRIHTREVGIRPWVELEPTDHPLAVDQREGMSEERLREILGPYLCRPLTPPGSSRPG